MGYQASGVSSLNTAATYLKHLRQPSPNPLVLKPSTYKTPHIFFMRHCKCDVPMSRAGHQNAHPISFEAAGWP